MIPSRYNLYFPSSNGERVIAFNTLSTSILDVSSEVASGIRSLGSCSEEAVQLSDEEQRCLEKGGFLVDEDRDETYWMKYNRNLAKYRGDKLHLTVILSPRCNLRCTYCWQDLRSGGNDLTEQQWAVILDYLKSAITKNRVTQLVVHLFGGEPLMNESLATQAAEDLRTLESEGVEVQIVLITNGTLLTAASVERFRHTIDTIQITVDGPEQRHNALRPFPGNVASFEAVMNGLRLSIDGGIPSVVVRTNFELNEFEQTRAFLHELAHELPSLLNVSASFSSILPAVSSLKSGCFSDHHEGKAAAVKLYEEAVNLGFRDKGFIFSSGPCHSQAISTLVIDQNLSLFRCVLQLYDEPCARLQMDGSFEVLRDEWFSFSTEESECLLTCIYAPICTGGCPALGAHNEGPEKCRLRDEIDATLGELLRRRIRLLGADS